MVDQISKLDATPQFLAIQAIHTSANPTDKTPGAPGHQRIQIEAALLCHRAGEAILRRLITPL